MPPTPAPKELVDRAKGGDADACLALGDLYSYRSPRRRTLGSVASDLKMAARWYRLGTRSGSASCMLALAHLLDVGDGVRKSAREAMRLWITAARLGESIAATNLALAYKAAGNTRASMRWFCRALAMGDGGAALEIGKLQVFGVGVRRDVHAGISRLRQAANDETLSIGEREESILLLAYMYLDGTVVSRNREAGLRWLDIGIEHGSSIARECKRFHMES